MPSTVKVDNMTRARAYYLHRVQGLPVRQVATLCNISAASVWNFSRAKERPRAEVKTKRVRSRKLTKRQERDIIRALKKLRLDEGNFCTKRLMQEAKIDAQFVCTKTVQRCLHRHGYFYLQSRKKGLMNSDDLKKRVRFARKMRKNYAADVWTNEVAFYLDATGFTYKRNPFDQARAPKGRIWRKKSEGTQPGCVAKGRKEGTGGKTVKLVVAISHDTGVLACEPYERMCGEYFAGFIRRNFPRMFQAAQKGNSRLWIQDNDRSQNCKLADEAMTQTNAELINIPPRSPDLNPIENFFNIVGKRLREGAFSQRITRETHEEFQRRVIATIKNIPTDTINALIESMPRRIIDVIANKGIRLKY